jgi:shikimate kinase
VKLHNIVITGFMGTGKSTVGPLVADELGWPFIDSDDEISAGAGLSIPAIFERYGEAHFRELEAEVCTHLAASSETVISTGGGALLHEGTRRAFLSHSLIICLSASLEVIVQRISDQGGRLLFADIEQARLLYEQRASVYTSLPHQIGTGNQSPQEIAGEIVRLWQNQH